MIIYLLIFLLRTVASICSCLPMAASISAYIDAFVLCSVYETLKTLRKQRSSNESILLFISVDSVHDSHPKRAVEVTMALISRIFEGSVMSLLRHMGYSLASALVAITILILISVSERPSFVCVDPRHLKEFTASNFPPQITISCCGPSVLMLSTLFLATLSSIPYRIKA